MAAAPVVVLSGALGAGKTTLGRRLVEPLGATLLSKDLLKESMFEPLSLDDDASSLRGSAAAMRILFDVASASHAPLVLDANWRTMDVLPLLALERPLLQVFCSAPGPVLKQRVLERVASGERHPVHRDGMSSELLQRIAAKVESGGAAPLDLGCEVVTVDTTVEVDVAMLAEAIRDRLGR